MIIGRGDPAPYNAVWDADRVAGFFDWDNAGPTTCEADLVWVAFAWTPLHAREVVESEGFTAFSQRRRRLEVLLGAYGWQGSIDGVIAAVATRLSQQVNAMRLTADLGDPAYRAMIQRGQDRVLESARESLRDL